MNYQNTPLEEINLSPSQLMMGRRLKTSLPTTKPLLRSQTADQVQRVLRKQKENYDKCTGKELSAVQAGKTIQIKYREKWIPAKVLRKHQSPHSYLVENEQTGQQYRRNRRHLHSTRVPASGKRTCKYRKAESEQ